MEAGGVEPPSAYGSGKASTCVDRCVISLRAVSDQPNP